MSANSETERRYADVVNPLAQLDLIYASAPVGLCVLDRSLRYVRVNERLAEINGVSVEDHLGRTVREVVPGIADAVERIFRRIIQTGEPVLNFEITGDTKAQPGVTRYWNESWYPLKDQAGRVIGVNIVANETTEQHRAEAALRASESCFRVAQDSSLVAFTILKCVRDETGVIVDFRWEYINPAAAKILKRDIHDLLGKRLLEVLPGNKARSRLFDAYVRVVQTGVGHELEVSYEADGISGTFHNVCTKIDDGVAIWFLDVSERHRAMEELARQREELQTTFEVIPVGVAIAQDPRCDLIAPSRRFAELLGIAPGQNESLSDPGQEQNRFRFLRNGTELPPEQLPLQQAVRTGREVRDVEFDVQHADGRVLNLMGSAAPLFDSQREVRGGIGAYVDVTPLKQVQRDLEAADRQKDEFLAMLAHELRNPLAAISNAGELLARTVAEDHRAYRVVDMVRRQVGHLTRLVDDLLDVARIRRGRIVLKRQIVELASVVQHAVETAGPLLREKRHRLTIAPSYGPLCVDGDFDRLVQCVNNVLTNAAKYTDPEGDISIAMREESGQAVVEIADSGVGIAPHVLPHVFDLFVQGDRSADRSQGGLGIGLSVVQRLIRKHGGDVIVYSEGLGHGSRFTIRLPLARQQPEPIAEVWETQAAAKRVLVVDDNADAADSLAMVLQLEGHEAKAVYTGAEAIKALESFKADVILLDIGLPHMDGYELARRIRAMPGERCFKLIALTGYSQPEDRQKAIECRLNGHLVKPVTFESLRAVLG
ncbi:MAG TPA: PAS domain-containing protein [Steroidobacter sp.]|nr:PAS domain-containing protein [Steroidobacter sp.]